MLPSFSDLLRSSKSTSGKDVDTAAMDTAAVNTDATAAIDLAATAAIDSVATTAIPTAANDAAATTAIPTAAFDAAATTAIPTAANDAAATTAIPTVGATAIHAGPSRVETRRRRRDRKRLLVAGSVLAIGAVVGSGFAVQAAVTDHQVRSAQAIAGEAQAVELRAQADQTSAHVTLSTTFATRTAQQATDDGNAAIAAAAGKTDTAELAAAVTELSTTIPILPDRVIQLASQTKAVTATVLAATAEVDRVSAEQTAAQAAAEAAAKAAADKAAADAAAQKEEKEAASSVATPPSRPAAPTDPSGAQAIARDMMASKYGWGDDEFGCLVSLWNKESGWNVNAYNASSGATGIPQALPGSKMASAGADWETNPATQISWGLSYIAGSYGTPCAAWDKSEVSGWY